jgi:hypothetical protein
VDIKSNAYFQGPLSKQDNGLDFEKKRFEYARPSEVFELLLNVPDLEKTLGEDVIEMSHRT